MLRGRSTTRVASVHAAGQIAPGGRHGGHGSGVVLAMPSSRVERSTIRSFIPRIVVARADDVDTLSGQ